MVKEKAGNYKSGKMTRMALGVVVVGLCGSAWAFSGAGFGMEAANVASLVVVVEPNVVEGIYYVDDVNGSDDNSGLTPETAFATVQKGIDTATDGNTVIVYPAVYNEEIDFLGKAITVQGVPSRTGAPILEAPGDYAVSFYRLEGPDSLLKNFVIRGSDLGIFIVGSSPTISNVTVVNNMFGIAAYAGAQPDIRNSIIWNNTDGDLFGDPLPIEAKYSFIQQDVNEPNVPFAGLVSHWKFDEGSGTTAYDSAGTNDGTIYGATWTTGKINAALSFDDVDDYVKVIDDLSLRFTQYDSFSVSFWAKPSTGGYVFSKLHAHLQSGQFGYALRWLAPPKFQFMTQKSRVNNVFVDTTDNSAPAGSWYYVTAVYDNKYMKIYLDGELKGTAFFGYDTGSTTPDNNFTIGVRLYDSTLEQYFGGIIDDVIVFDRALSVVEIRQLYQPLGGPLFGDDYHLRSKRGRHWPAHDVWVLDNVTSPCIDGGDPSVNPYNERMPNGGRINMGAYGNTAYASMSEWPIAEDNNRDGVVNMLDIARLAAKWLEKLEWVE